MAGAPGSPLARIVLLALYTLALTVPVSALPLAYRLKVGSTYSYEIVQRSTSEVSSNEIRSSHPQERTTKLEVLVLAFRDGVYVLDILSGDRRIRRYMRPNGAVVASPSEPGTELPFFAVFPEGDAVTGKPWKQTTSFPLGKGTVPASWETTLTGLDGSKKKATVTVTGSVTLPSDRVISRSLQSRGTLVLNLETGCPDRADWTVSYELTYANKEIAVTRDLWSVRETRSSSCKLTGVKP
ncbi:MAG TPA: hypothetical protein PLP29_03025 [Candidatus Ozemobacteraceae bacterium]|nr:hypothetical protein [Candidatus Ozemobacteraceae bacterium]